MQHKFHEYGLFDFLPDWLINAMSKVKNLLYTVLLKKNKKQSEPNKHKSYKMFPNEHCTRENVFHMYKNTPMCQNVQCAY